MSKLIMLEGFKEQLGQSPLIPRLLIDATAYGIPAFELLIVVLLYFDKTRTFAFYASFFLMAAFTVYLVMLLSIDETLPCSCGGILGQIGFKEHVVFNLFFCAISVVGVWFEKAKSKGSYA